MGKEGTCEAAVVKVDETMGLVCFILNCIPITSGVGTMITACCNGGEFRGTTFLFGLLQFLLCWTIICYVWSIVFGYWIFQKSR